MQNFIECDREQVFLLPPDVRDWLPEGHLAWFVLDAVAGMDLAAFYRVYRMDGHGRPAYEPSMMVALLLYSYSRGVRSARGIERACEENVAYRVIAAQQKPDHATIARFVERHEAALAGLFGAVLGLCADAGLARVGVIAIYGETRGDELPEHLSTSQGRRGWLREAQRQLDDKRAEQAAPVRQSRPARLKESKRRLEEELRTECQANKAYEAYRARGVMKNGRRMGAPPKPYQPPGTPDGKINVTDLDSRLVKGMRGWIQGYNAQAAVNEAQIVLAAEISVSSPDFGQLEPILLAATAELERAGVTDLPGIVLADAGYWHQEQIERIVERGTPVLIAPDSSRRKAPRPGWEGGLYAFMRSVLDTDHGAGLYRQRQQLIEPVFGQTKFNRRMERFHRRGRSAVRTEWRLITATHNLLKLHKHQLTATAA
jgi:transposase